MCKTKQLRRTTDGAIATIVGSLGAKGWIRLVFQQIGLWFFGVFLCAWGVLKIVLVGGSFLLSADVSQRGATPGNGWWVWLIGSVVVNLGLGGYLNYEAALQLCRSVC